MNFCVYFQEILSLKARVQRQNSWSNGALATFPKSIFVDFHKSIFADFHKSIFAGIPKSIFADFPKSAAREVGPPLSTCMLSIFACFFIFARHQL